MDIFKAVWANLKDKSTTGAAVMTIAAYIINQKIGVLPREVADAALLIIDAVILALFAKKGALTK